MKASTESKRNIFEFLKSNPVGVLATVSPEGKPHAAAVYFSINEKFKITFVTKLETRKYNNLSHNNNVMLVSFEPKSQTTAQITGQAEEITGIPDEAMQALRSTIWAALKTSETGIPPTSKLLAGNLTAFRIEPTQIRMAKFMRPDPGGYDIYETINF